MPRKTKTKTRTTLTQYQTRLFKAAQEIATIRDRGVWDE